MENKKLTIVIAVAQEKTRRKDALDVLRCKESVEKALIKNGFLVKSIYVKKEDFKNPEALIKIILKLKPHSVFNLFEGFSDDSKKEAEFAKLLEGAAIRFTGSLSYTLDTCLDKIKTKGILSHYDIPVPRGIFVNRTDNISIDSLFFPLFIKPALEDASLGIDSSSLVVKRKALRSVVEKKIKEFPTGLIIEEFIAGCEYNVALLGNFHYKLLGISVLDYSKYKTGLPFLSYPAKWDSSFPEYKILFPSLDAKIKDSLRKKIIALSIKTAKILGCRGYCRIDLREKNGNIFILDVNPNPDINKDSGFINQACQEGFTYEDIVTKIVNLSLDPNFKI